MKVDPVVTNADQLYIANMTQINKIKFLQTEKAKRESYIKDLQETLGLNKQSIYSLACDKNEQSIKTLNRQNMFLITKLKTYYEDYMDVNAKLLIEQQLRIQEKKFYSERILDFENNMTELRKYLQDKQQSFSSVVTRLKKYEDLNQVTLETKLHKIANDLNEQFIDQLLKKLTEERDRYKSICEKINVDLDDLIFLRSCLENKKSYETLQNTYSKYKQKEVGKQDKGLSFYEKSKNSTNYSNNLSANISSVLGNKNDRSQNSTNNLKSPNKQLIKLLKKEKLSNEILQEALNQAIEKNEQLFLENQKIVQANQILSIQYKKLESKCYLMEKELTSKDKSLGWKQAWKSKCDIDRQERIAQFERRGEQEQHVVQKMTEDMQKLSSFIITCVPRGNLIKSSSNPNFTRNNQNVVDQEEDIQIQEI